AALPSLRGVPGHLRGRSRRCDGPWPGQSRPRPVRDRVRGGLAVALPTRVPGRPPGPAWQRRDPVLARPRAGVLAGLARLVVHGGNRGRRDVPLEAPRPASGGHPPPGWAAVRALVVAVPRVGAAPAADLGPL